jgi:hypothetical protein
MSNAQKKDFLFTWQFWRLVLVAWAAYGVYWLVKQA